MIPQVNGVAKAARGAAPKGWADGLPEELRSKDGGVVRGVTAGWAEEYAVPTECPACGTKPVEEGKYWRCPNTHGCQPQLVGRTAHLAGRGGFEIDRIGPKQIAQLFEVGLIGGPGDLFHLDRDVGQREVLVALERWGEKSVDGLFEQLEERRRVDFARFLVALAMTLGLHLFFKHSFMGRAVMAVAQDPVALQLMGAKPVRIKQFAFGIAIATAALAGAMLIVIGPVEPSMGRLYIGRVFAIAVLAGMGSIPGTLVAAIILGVAESLTATFYGPSWAPAVAFGILLVTLAVRPAGLFGR